MKAYLAGPMRGFECFNFPAFTEAAKRLRAAGHEIISPAEMDQEKFGWGECPTDIQEDGFTIEDALLRDYKAVVDVEAVILLPGWERSFGANFEKAAAEAIGRRVLFYTEVGDTFFLLENQPEREISHHAEEVRVVDPETGGAKGQKQTRLGAIDPKSLKALGDVAGMGEEKYDRFNYAKGYKWSLSIDAMFRHMLAFLDGEDNDEESGLPHMAHAAWHGLALTTFLLRQRGTDDRIT